MTVAELFASPNAWCQHSLLNEKGQRCLEGGLIFVYGDHTDAMIDAKRKVERALCEHNWFMSIPAFNDAWSTTHAKVLAIVREAGV